MLVHVIRLHVYGLYRRSILEPRFHFHFGVPVPVPSSAAVGAAHLLALAFAALGVALGVRSRVCAIVFALLYGYFVLCERTMFNNHFYLYTVLAALLALVEARSRFALVPCAGRAGAGDRCCWWELAALRAQLYIVYAYAGVAKLNSDWLLHAEPMATKLPAEAARHQQPLLGAALRSHEVAVAISLCGAAVDLSLPALLLSRGRSRRATGLALSLAFHGGNLLLWQLGEFPLVMISTCLLFLEDIPCLRSRADADAAKLDDAAHAAGADNAVRAPPPAAKKPTAPTTEPPEKPPAPARSRPARGARLCCGAAGAHLALQLLLPLRPLVASRFDPLDAVHTKAHTLLSWRFMAVTTRNFLNVSLVSPRLGATVSMTRTYNKLSLRLPNGSRVPLPLQPPLEARQAGYMPYTAPMLLQFARAAAALHPGASVHAEQLWSGVNGRPLQRFVSPAVDLASAALPATRRPEWVSPLLRAYGAAPWRARLRWLRATLGARGHDVALFADAPGGAPFDEAFPAVGGFPARALLVSLDGRLRVTTPRGYVRELEAPAWRGGAAGEPVAMEPRTAPVAIPFGAAHRVEAIGEGAACWAYVFGVDPAAERAAVVDQEESRRAARA